jgi:hypothetical protein
MARALAVVGVLLLVGGAIGCGGEEGISPVALPVQSYVGDVEGSDARVAVVEDGEELVAYLCGGPTSFATLTRWFRAPLPEQGSPFHLEKDGIVIEGSVSDGLAEGEIVASDGTRLAFQAEATPRGDLAGLYGAQDEGCMTGVIIGSAAPGEEPLVQGTWCSASGSRAQVIPILPAQIQPRGLEVRVVVGAETRHLFVTPIRPHAP